MSDFQLAFAYVVDNEKGFVDDPHDAGGPTNMGVTMATLSQYRRTLVTAFDIQDLTVAETESIYRSLYWEPLRLDAVASESMATAVLDAGVLFGNFESALCAQRALVAAGFTYLALDGTIGQRTVNALNTVHPSTFLGAFVVALTTLVTGIVSKHPVDVRYGKGWDARVKRYIELET